MRGLFLVFLASASHAFPLATTLETNRFDRLFHDARQYANSREVLLSAQYIIKAQDSESFHEIVQMGTCAIPLFAEKVLNNPEESPLDSFFYYNLWRHLTKTEWSLQENPWADDSIEMSWKGGKQLAETRIRFLLSEMRLAEKERRPEDAKRAKTAIVAQGVFAIEPLFDALNDRAEDIVAVLSEFSWIREECSSATCDELLSWWQENKERFSLPEKSKGFRVEPHLEKWNRLGK